MATDRAAMTYLALGDSYTIGEGVAPADRWPVRLTLALREGGLPLEFPRSFATTGWTTDELWYAMDAAQPPLGRYDFVSLQIGVNNQYRGRAATEYGHHFQCLLQRSIELAGARCDGVLVLSIPDWGVTRFGAESGRDRAAIAAELDAFNAAAAGVCADHAVAFVDITRASRAHGAETDMQADDGLHPSASMYALWVQQALPVARRLLGG